MAASSAATAEENPSEVRQAALDPRLNALQSFFRKFRSPLDQYAAAFLSAADRHGLDWRLLPSLAMVESGGGRYCSRNNVFGWGNGRIHFQSVQEGIAHVASALANAPHYARKDLIGKLRTYNPGHPAYPGKVLGFLQQLPLNPNPAPMAAGSR